MIHGACEEREASTGERSYERVGREGRVGEHEVNVNEVVETPMRIGLVWYSESDDIWVSREKGRHTA